MHTRAVQFLIVKTVLRVGADIELDSEVPACPKHLVYECPSPLTIMMEALSLDYGDTYANSLMAILLFLTLRVGISLAAPFAHH